jgi:molybdenum cofactor synthesis domain-containing protein
MTTAEIIAAGNELLIGDVPNTNTHWLCKRITGLGGRVTRAVMVGDDLEAIGEEIRGALARRAEVIFTTGGLGPTADDMTLAAVAQATGCPLELNDEAQEMVRHRYQELADQGFVADEALTEARRKMALLPRGARPVFNPVGAAPTAVLEVGGSILISLPGVPAELKGIFEGPLWPTLEALFGEGVFLEKVAIVACQDESALAPILRRVAEAHPAVYIKSRAKRFGPQVRLRVTLSLAGRQRCEVERAIDQALGDLREGLARAGIAIDAVEG